MKLTKTKLKQIIREEIQKLNEKKMVVTPISKIKDVKKKVKNGEVTYRGLGLGKTFDDFYDLAGEGGFRITVDKKEYFVTETDFYKLQKIRKMSFNAPFRR